MKLIILGAPGSGKGTISELLAKHNHFYHIAAGDLLRKEAKKTTALGKEIKQYINKGRLVPPLLPVKMVKQHIKHKKNYILDGFPRSLEQAKAIEDLDIDVVLYLNVNEQKIIKRLAGRRICEKEQHSYHTIFHPPRKKGICDDDGSKLIRRKDDDPRVIKERFKVFYAETMPVIQYYKKKGILKTVDASASPEKVYEKVRRAIHN